MTWESRAQSAERSTELEQTDDSSAGAYYNGPLLPDHTQRS